MKTKYISLKKFLSNPKSILEEVLTEKVEYIVMINKEPKIRICIIDDGDEKELILEKDFDKEKLSKFI